MYDYEPRSGFEFENVLNFLANRKGIINCAMCICQIYSGLDGMLVLEPAVVGLIRNYHIL